ncbi:MAG TPA: transcription antitermination factor NusB [Mycobacteriales bacterium]|nr:transcription antitermination factor NusB [Mycobacteriales bacterium]
MKDARRVAYDLLRAVDERDAYANLLLPTLVTGLEPRDRAFAAELGYGTLRALGTLDHVLGLCASRPVAEMDPPVRDVLRLGAYQLLRTRVAPHAAVSTSVDLARTVAGPGAAKFANAVLRRVAGRDGDLGAPPYDEDPAGHLAVTTAHPRWIVAAFHDALGGDWAETRRALEADDARPEVHLVARPGRIARDGLLASCRAAGLEADAGPLSPYAVRLSGGDPGDVAAVRDGSAGVQDEGSQVAALTLTRLLGEGRHDVLDLCAGPGGKAALLAGTLPAGRLVANELHEHRARLVAHGLAAARGVPYAVVTGDGRRGPWRPGTFDGVLLDAPCTGLGALRRRPEARWRRRPEGVAPLAALQRDLLAAALDAVRPGGVVVYVVCSPHPAETTAVVASAAGAEPVSEPVQLWPHRDATDAMFVAGLRRPAR